MTEIERRRRSYELLRYVNAAAALVAAAVVLGLAAVGWGSVPAPGPALVPGHGVWSATSANHPRAERPVRPGQSGRTDQAVRHEHALRSARVKPAQTNTVAGR
jgi:hypothetical protein